MLDQLINELPTDVVDSFLKRAKIAKPSEFDIAKNGNIITKEAGSALSKSIAGVHTAFNSINTSVITGNKIEKAKMIRAEQVAKENMMEMKDGRSAINIASLFKFPVDKLVKNFDIIDNLFNELANSLEKLDLSCNICQIPCDDEYDKTKRVTRTGTPTRTLTRVPVEVPVSLPRTATKTISLPAPPISEPVSLPKSLPAPSVRAPVTEVVAPKGLEYQPLPEPLEIKSTRQPQPVEVTRAQAPKTIAQEFYEGKYTAEQAKDAFKAQRQAQTQSAAPTQKPAATSTKPRWTSTVPKEQYFDNIRANQAETELARKVSGSRPAGNVQSKALVSTTPKPKAAARGPGAFARGIETIAGSKVAKVGGKALGVAGVGLDVYGRAQSGESVGKIATGVGSGLAGAQAGAYAGAAGGAALGSIVPVVGTAAGGIIGGLLGGAAGYFAGSKLGDTAYNYFSGDKKKPQATKVKTAQQAQKKLSNATKQIASQAKGIDQAQDSSLLAFRKKNLEFTSFVTKSMATISSSVTSFLSNLGSGAMNIGNDVVTGLQQGFEGITPASGNEATATAMSFFMSKGWTKEQAAGIVGNLQVESGNFDPNVVLGRKKGDNGRAVGIAQWHPDRQGIFQQQFKRPLVGAGLQEQLQFVQYELTSNEKKAGDRLKKATTPEDAAAIIDQFYERSSGQHRGQRIANARSLAGRDSFATQAGRMVGGGVGAVTGAVQSAGRYASQALSGLGGLTPTGLNGNLPASMLASIGVGNHRLQPAAANAFKAMSAAAKAAGIPLPITDSYRTYEAQVRLKREKGNMAATPGRSNHGWGLALDISTGGDKSKIFNWLVNNASRFGWRGPLSRPYEPWHWEFAGTGTSKPMAAPNPKAATPPPSSPPATGGARPAQPGKQATIPGKSVVGGTRTVVLEKNTKTAPKTGSGVAIGAKKTGSKTNKDNSNSYLAYFGIG